MRLGRNSVIKLIAFSSVLVAGLSVAGWIFNIEFLKSVIPGYTSMKFNAALCLIFAGTVLYLFQQQPGQKWFLYFFSFVPMLVAMLTVVQSNFSIDFGIDQFFIPDTQDAIYPGRMAQSTAISLILLNAGYLLLIKRRGWSDKAAQYLFHSVTLISFIAVAGYFFGVEAMHKLDSYASMALHTSIILLLCSIGAALLQPTLGVIAMFYGENIGNRMARRVFPLIFIAVVALGGIRVIAHRYDTVGVEFGIAMLMTSFILVSLVVIERTARWLNRANDGRNFANSQLSNFREAITISSIVSITDLKGTIEYVNENFVAISGYSEHELLGQNHRIINSEHHSKEFWIDMWKTLATGKTWRADVKNKAKDGSYYWVDTFVIPLVDLQRKPKQFISIRNDITSRKHQEVVILRLNESLRATNVTLEARVAERTAEISTAHYNLQLLTDQLNQYNDVLKRYIHIISHNLRSHAVNLTYLLRFVREEKTENGRADLLNRMDGVVNDFSSTLNALVEVVKIQGEKDVKTEPLNLDLLLANTLRVLNMDLTSEHVKVSCDFTSAPVLRFPKVYMESVFLNLISNSIKYRSPKRQPVIHLRSWQEEDFFWLSVSDNGLGIDLKKYGHKLFGLNKTFHRHPQAKGVGLFITHSQIESQGGEIMAESIVNEGTTFKIRIPQSVLPGKPHP